MYRVWRMLVAAVCLLWWSSAQAPPPHCPHSPATACKSISLHTPYTFNVQGITVYIKYEESTSLQINCEKGGSVPSALNESAMPQFASGLLVPAVRVFGCPAPGRSYRALLAALNVSFPPAALDSERKLIIDHLRGSIHLGQAHFAGLAGVGHLELHDVGPLSVAFLKELPLKTLVVTDSPILESELDTVSKTLNSSLAYLSLLHTKVSRVPAPVIELPTLETLKVSGSAGVRLERGAGRALPALRTLFVEVADRDLFSEWAPPRVRDVTLAGWEAESPDPVPECPELRVFTVKSPRVRALPEGWVARCPLLETLEVKLARNLTSLPEKLLANATSLLNFTFKNGALESLPSNLFLDARNLTSIDLTDNHLKVLPSGVFYKMSVRVLRLSRNQLSWPALRVVGALASLRTLELAHNADVTGRCGGAPIQPDIFVEHKGESALANLHNLEYLDLKNTSVTAICKDWRETMKNMICLDLRFTKIHTLTAEDLQFKWWNKNNDSNVRLDHTPISGVEYGPEQFAADESAGTDAARVRVYLGGPETRLPCDCTLYWVAAAVRARVGPLGLAEYSAFWCNSTDGARQLDLRRIDHLVCDSSEACAGVPARCRCGTRDLSGNRTLLRVDCAGAGLAAPPRLAALPPKDSVLVDLLLADNSIEHLDADDLPRTLNTLDLRNNSIACDCRTAAALRNPLRSRARLELTCAGADRPETALGALHCGEPLGAALGVAALLVAACGGALLAHPATRGWLKRALGRWRRAPPPAAAPTFDLFLTFQSGWEPLALEMAARLEPRYAVCVQERDWLPPARLGACFAESVARSRRTLALVSPEWARALDAEAEVGAALAGALRGSLLAVLLAEPPPGALRRYLHSHPHAALPYSDDRFWQKLFEALPPPAAPRPPDKTDVIV